MKTIIVLDTAQGLDYPVKLEQRNNGLFRVTYGVQMHDNLTYSSAAREFGECIFHSLACAGNLNAGECDE